MTQSPLAEVLERFELIDNRDKRVLFVDNVGPRVAGIYRHNASGGLYFADGLALREEDYGLLVVYRNRLGVPFVRTLANFCEVVPETGRPRFERVAG